MNRENDDRVSLLGLEPGSYRSHRLHDSNRAYPETNCYTDIVIELVHAFGEEPLAMMSTALAVDFEGDQWTFFKPRPEDLLRLYGIDIHEMQPYRPLPEQIAEQIGCGRTLCVELDSWYLPDTEGTSYRREHVKSSVVPEAINLEAQTLRYFHGRDFHELTGEDYRGALRLDSLPGEALPPYCELVRFDAGQPLRGEALRAAGRELLAEAAERRPAINPFEQFGRRLQQDLPRLLEGDVKTYHDYAFATVRMAGSAFEAAGSHIEWLIGETAAPAQASIASIVEGCKLLSFKLARRRQFDPAPAIAELSEAWTRVFEELGDALA